MKVPSRDGAYLAIVFSAMRLMGARMVARPLIALTLLLSSAPAWASDGTAVPEGSQVTLFALGVLGVIIGRRASMRGRKRD